MDTEPHARRDAALLTPKEAATFLRCSRQWLAVMRMRGQGPAYLKHGTWVRYRVADLTAWTEARRVQTSQLAAA
jgi:hypothetical protein